MGDYEDVEELVDHMEKSNHITRFLEDSRNWDQPE